MAYSAAEGEHLLSICGSQRLEIDLNPAATIDRMSNRESYTPGRVIDRVIFIASPLQSPAIQPDDLGTGHYRIDRTAGTNLIRTLEPILAEQGRRFKASARSCRCGVRLPDGIMKIDGCAGYTLGNSRLTTRNRDVSDPREQPIRSELQIQLIKFAQPAGRCAIAGVVSPVRKRAGQFKPR